MTFSMRYDHGNLEACLHELEFADTLGRREALRNLKKTPELLNDLVGILVKRLGDPDYEVRMEITKLLGVLNIEDVLLHVDAVVHHLQYVDSEIRKELVWLIRAAPLSCRQVTVLLQLLGDEDEEVRWRTAKLLSRKVKPIDLSPHAAAIAAQLGRECDPDTRKELVHALCGLRQPIPHDCVIMLIYVCCDTKGGERRAALDVLNTVVLQGSATVDLMDALKGILKVGELQLHDVVLQKLREQLLDDCIEVRQAVIQMLVDIPAVMQVRLAASVVELLKNGSKANHEIMDVLLTLPLSHLGASLRRTGFSILAQIPLTSILPLTEVEKTRVASIVSFIAGQLTCPLISPDDVVQGISALGVLQKIHGLAFTTDAMQMLLNARDDRVHSFACQVVQSLLTGDRAEVRQVMAAVLMDVAVVRRMQLIASLVEHIRTKGITANHEVMRIFLNLPFSHSDAYVQRQARSLLQKMSGISLMPPTDDEKCLVAAVVPIIVQGIDLAVADDITLSIDVLGVLSGIFEFALKGYYAHVFVDGNSLLHLAAKEGNLKLCESLVRLGAPIRCRNRKNKTPESLAQSCGHAHVKDFFNRYNKPHTQRVGTGDAIGFALHDRRPVVEVQWYTIPLAGWLGSLGGTHSLLRIVVEADDILASRAIYVIEKAQPTVISDEWKNGVYISWWDGESGVQSHVDSGPIHELKRQHIENHSGMDELCIGALRQLAVSMGEYDVGSCNCHHAAFTLYNSCACLYLQVPEMPNSLLTGFAFGMQHVGLNVATSRSSQATCETSFGDVESFSDLDSSGPPEFPLAGNCDHVDALAILAARLCKWVYSFSSCAPCGIKIRSAADSHIQRSIATSADAIFVAFRGTDSLYDIIVDLSILPCEDSAYHLKVHSGMRSALHQEDQNGEYVMINSLISEIERLRNQHPELQSLVLCGHSLGAGYALLVGLELLHRNIPVSNVIAFGAPQVIIPKYSDPLWSRLNQITTTFVNEWDCVPRLPACSPWFCLIPAFVKSCVMSRGIGSSRSDLDLSHKLRSLEALRDAASEYGTVGSILFISETSSKLMRVMSEQTGEHMQKLSMLPSKLGSFILEQHAVDKYASITEKFSIMEFGDASNYESGDTYDFDTRFPEVSA